MGYLSDGGGADAGTVDTSAPEDTAQDTSNTGDQQQGGEAVETEAPRTERVTVPSRRQAAAARRTAVETQLETLTKTVTESSTRFQSELAARDAEIARLRGGFDVLAPLLQQRQQAERQQAAPDADQLLREAKKALDANDFDEYTRLNHAAIEARIMSKMPAQTAPQQQANPIVNALLYQHQAVLNAGQRGIDLAILEDNKLALMGIPASPDRFRKAFETAENTLAPGKANAYSQDSRGVLSGLPPSRSNGGSQRSVEAGVNLSALELQWAAAAGMSKEEYAKAIAERDPKRLG